MPITSIREQVQSFEVNDTAKSDHDKRLLKNEWHVRQSTAFDNTLVLAVRDGDGKLHRFRLTKQITEQERTVRGLIKTMQSANFGLAFAMGIEDLFHQDQSQDKVWYEGKQYDMDGLRTLIRDCDFTLGVNAPARERETGCHLSIQAKDLSLDTKLDRLVKDFIIQTLEQVAQASPEALAESEIPPSVARLL